MFLSINFQLSFYPTKCISTVIFMFIIIIVNFLTVFLIKLVQAKLPLILQNRLLVLS